MIWKFCLHSLFREYGWQFLRRIAAAHPIKTVKAFVRTVSIDASGDMTDIDGLFVPGAGAIVGVGFCLKPIYPPCPSGRANHNCRYLEHAPFADAPACRSCVIGEFGTLALEAGCAFYIMTSAHDILLDVFEPSLRNKLFTSGLFVLCRYSTRPFSVAMLASGIRGCVIHLEHGDCQNYQSWRLADRGIKSKQTRVGDSNRAWIKEILSRRPEQEMLSLRFAKRGNIFFAQPLGTGQDADEHGAARTQVDR